MQTSELGILQLPQANILIKKTTEQNQGRYAYSMAIHVFQFYLARKRKGLTKSGSSI